MIAQCRDAFGIHERIWSALRGSDDAPSLDPLVDVVRVEADELADLEERDAALGDQTPYETLRHAEPFSESGDVDQSILR